MSRGKRKTPDALPKVEHGIAMPQKFVDGRTGANREKPESLWPAYLKFLNVGDSFAIDPWELAAVQQYAKRLNLDLVHRRDEITRVQRVWLYGKPGQRNPMYQMIDGRKYELNEIEPQPAGSTGSKGAQQ